MVVQVIILSVTGMIGRIGLGFASDIVGPWNLLVPVSGGMVLMMFTMCTVYVKSIPVQSHHNLDLLNYLLPSQGIKSLVAFSIFYGLFAGACKSI